MKEWINVSVEEVLAVCTMTLALPQHLQVVSFLEALVEHAPASF
jgi:hypothetical protein